MSNISISPQDSLKLLFQHPVFITSVSSFIISQILKAIFTFFFEQKKKKLKDILITLLWSTGGMPSSHAALVTSMATSTALNEGFSSTIFVISLFLAFIVIRDALGVRRAAGMQAKAINVLSRKISARLNVECPSVKEIQGHTPPEVAIGSLLGIFSAILFQYIK